MMTGHLSRKSQRSTSSTCMMHHDSWYISQRRWRFYATAAKLWLCKASCHFLPIFCTLAPPNLGHWERGSGQHGQLFHGRLASRNHQDVYASSPSRSAAEYLWLYPESVSSWFFMIFHPRSMATSGNISISTIESSCGWSLHAVEWRQFASSISRLWASWPFMLMRCAWCAPVMSKLWAPPWWDIGASSAPQIDKMNQAWCLAIKNWKETPYTLAVNIRGTCMYIK